MPAQGVGFDVGQPGGWDQVRMAPSPRPDFADRSRAVETQPGRRSAGTRHRAPPWPRLNRRRRPQNERDRRGGLDSSRTPPNATRLVPASGALRRANARRTVRLMPPRRHDGAPLGGPPRSWPGAQNKKRPPKRSRLASHPDGPGQPRPWGEAPGWVGGGRRVCLMLAYARAEPLSRSALRGLRGLGWVKKRELTPCFPINPLSRSALRGLLELR
jgi:hypothetical protein